MPFEDYNPTVMDHFLNPRNTGELAQATHSAFVKNPVCGDQVKLTIESVDRRGGRGIRTVDLSVTSRAVTKAIIGPKRGVGPEVTELLPELTLAQKWDLTATEVARNIHAHPTLSETLGEVAHGITGHMINI